MLRALAARAGDLGEAALLLVCDEEWRLGPLRPRRRASRAATRACASRPAQLDPGSGEDAVVVRRKAAGTIKVVAQGRSSHSGSAPDKGVNALLAAAAAAQAVAGVHAPAGADHLTAVPTVLHAGEAFNVVPDHAELVCDVRADRSEAFDRVLGAVPAGVGEATLAAELIRVWPGMDSEGGHRAAARRRRGAPRAPGRGGARGGASDASHFAASIPLTVDGLGPRGGGAHAVARARPGALGAPAGGDRAGPGGRGPGASTRHRADAGTQGFRAGCRPGVERERARPARRFP